MATKNSSSDKIYKLKNGAPLSFTLASRNHSRFPLLWFDEKNNINRALRYAVNQKSPFEDEQDDNAILEPIIFEDGFLSVPRTNPVLQQFLHYHPQNGVVFVEVDNEKDASEEIKDINVEVDAMIEARKLTIDQLEIVYRVLFSRDPSTMTTAELRRDVLVYAKKDPEHFMHVIEDPTLKHQSKVRVFFDKGLLVLKNNQKEVWFNTPSNKKKMMNVPFGDDPMFAVAQYLQSDDGIDSLKLLDSCL